MLSIPKNTEPANGDVHKRRAQRQRIETLAYADLGPDNGGFSINISEMGMAFQGIQPLEKHQVISIKFKLPGINDVVETQGEVIWLNDLGKGGGLEFINLAEESRLLINHWLSLQAPADSQIASVPPSPRQVKKREAPFPAPSSPAVHEGSRAFKSDLNLVSQLPPSSFPAVTTEPATDNKSTAGLLRSQGKDEPLVQKSGNKRGWIIPFAAGLLTSLAAMIGVMVAYGVISIRIHWPQQVADAGSTRPLAETGSAKVVDSPTMKISHDGSVSDRAATGLSSSTPPSATSSRSPIVAPAAPKVSAPVRDRTRTPSTPEVESPKTPLPQATTPKDIAPSPITPAKTLDIVPPSVALPMKSELAPQLPMAIPDLPGPALPISSPVPKASNLEPPVLIKRKDPVYSEDAKQKGISGAVELHFTINAQGNVRDVKVVKGNLLLGNAAIAAVQEWHYQPARLNGIPVDSDSSVVVNFRPN
jgi:TonB family protein